jgi:hypothetical protein
LLTLIGAICFAFPALLIPRFSWTLTPLTTRSLCAWLILFGTLLLCMVRENDRTRCRLASLMLIFALPALIVQMLRFRAEVNAGSPALWIGLGLFAIAFFCGLCLARGSWRTAMR